MFKIEYYKKPFLVLLKRKEDHEVEQVVSSQAVCVLIGSSLSISVVNRLQFLEWIGAPILLLILVSSCSVKVKDCVGGREFIFSLKSYLKASCFVGIKIMYNKKLLKNMYLKKDLLKCFQYFSYNS